MLSIQGGNALEGAPNGPRDIPDRMVTRVTLVHLTNSVYGATSSPDHYLRKNKGLSQKGFELVEQLNAERIFVDLAHVHPKGFWDALSVHKTGLPPIATHTGVDGGRRHWRNLDDKQIKAIADRGGVVGLIFAANFLKGRGMPNTAEMVVRHLEHVINIAGESTAAIGSDLDGAISPPPDLSSGFAYAALVDAMLNRGWSEKRIRGIMAENFLNSWALLRP
jgi:membrane dipeptidase